MTPHERDIHIFRWKMYRDSLAGATKSRPMRLRSTGMKIPKKNPRDWRIRSLIHISDKPIKLEILGERERIKVAFIERDKKLARAPVFV